MMETTFSSETSVLTGFSRSRVLSILHSHRREKLKPYLSIIFYKKNAGTDVTIYTKILHLI
jgi:hypothetical protein